MIDGMGAGMNLDEILRSISDTYPVSVRSRRFCLLLTLQPSLSSVGPELGHGFASADPGTRTQAGWSYGCWGWRRGDGERWVGDVVMIDGCEHGS